ncbi:mechanosensitive ion channel family protein [Heyndrickxia vini]|uniref:Mechanosensitive ion channel family protein n=1 Tax=Heyndrickxia vini TaxID=1476025 RepID=A0ABX7DXP9_9BACI|nr:mechanosensitive ion channel family protein [Heyndrickxia vini]QQZ08106.1 mechanosensitive ion channel family protein [Heyndrickxia vini]
MDWITKKLTEFDWTGFLLQVGMFLLKLVIIYIIYKIVKVIGRKIIHTSFEKYQSRMTISTARSKTLQNLVDNTFSYVLVFILFVTLLQTLGIKTTGILAGAGIVGLAVGFGAQGLVSDVVTGFFLLLEKQVDVDDYVTIGSFSGVVEQVGLRTTQIRSTDGTLHFLPNRQITTLSNHSRGNMQALVDFSIGDPSSIDHAINIIQQACDQIAIEDDNIVEGPNVLGVQSFESSDIQLRVIARTKNGKQSGVERKLKKVIKETIDSQIKVKENSN